MKLEMTIIIVMATLIGFIIGIGTNIQIQTEEPVRIVEHKGLAQIDCNCPKIENSRINCTAQIREMKTELKQIYEVMTE